MNYVIVYCPICRGGNNIIWKGTLNEWSKELNKETPPEWANYAIRHEKAHNHQIMVSYPSGKVIPFDIGGVLIK